MVNKANIEKTALMVGGGLLAIYLFFKLSNYDYSGLSDYGSLGGTGGIGSDNGGTLTYTPNEAPNEALNEAPNESEIPRLFEEGEPIVFEGLKLPGEEINYTELATNAGLVGGDILSNVLLDVGAKKISKSLLKKGGELSLDTSDISKITKTEKSIGEEAGKFKKFTEYIKDPYKIEANAIKDISTEVSKRAEKVGTTQAFKDIIPAVKTSRLSKISKWGAKLANYIPFLDVPIGAAFEYGADYFDPNLAKEEKISWGDALAITGAGETAQLTVTGTGALIGSVVPVAGTGVGAVVGQVAGTGADIATSAYVGDKIRTQKQQAYKAKQEAAAKAALTAKQQIAVSVKSSSGSSGVTPTYTKATKTIERLVPIGTKKITFKNLVLAK